MFCRPSSWTLALVAIGGCNDSSSIDGPVGASRIEVQVGPGGRVLQGDGKLEGFVLTIPSGALSRLVTVTIEPGAPTALPGTRPVMDAIQIRVSPDPGVLRRTAVLALPLDLTPTEHPEDLVVAGRVPAEEPSALPEPDGRIVVLADFGLYDDDANQFTTSIRTLTDLQLRLSEKPRLAEDSIRLVGLGYGALGRFTDASLREADVLFSEAVEADRFSPAANLFRALSRVLVALNDRTDSGSGLDSVGEALSAIGFDVETESLATRLRTGRWPRHVQLPANAPDAADISDLLRRRVRPALELALRDLDRVSYASELILTLPDLFPSLPGEREVDASDVLILRSVLAGAIWAMDYLEDLLIDADGSFLTSDAGRALTLEQALERFGGVGRMRSLPDATTIAALSEALFALSRAFDVLAAEDDDQSNDLVVFARSMTPERLDVWRANLDGLARASREEVTTRLALGGGDGSLLVDLLRPYRSGAFEPRVFLPELLNFLPIAGTLPDPTLGGLLPGMTQQRAAELVRMVNMHELIDVPTIVADGLVADWPAATEALRPPDPIGDLSEPGLAALDLRRMFLADSGDYIALRLQLASDRIVHRPEQETIYGFTVQTLGKGSLGGRIEAFVNVTANELDVRVDRDGQLRAVRFFVGARDGELELLLNRFDLLDPDEPIVDRVVHGFSLGIDLTNGVQDGDRTRPVAVRF